MKKKILTSLAILITCTSLSYAEITTNSKETTIYPITISIVDAFTYQDTNFIHTNLKRSDLINNLTISSSSKGLTELTGTYSCSKDILTDEIKAISQDRFIVDAGFQPLTGMLVKLKK
ncbi:MAG: hypothetical protein COS89_08295, partial [Deltaproteobacteria bacterium CG07_land_8_20_14_0_80_38_7]